MFKDRSLDPLDYAKFTVDTFGIKAVDLWEGGLPGDKLDNKNYLEKLRTSCADAGTRLFLLMIAHSTPIPIKQQQVITGCFLQSIGLRH